MKLFDEFKDYSTKGHPELFWRWVGLNGAIVVVISGLTHLGVSFLKYKGIF